MNNDTAKSQQKRDSMSFNVDQEGILRQKNEKHVKLGVDDDADDTEKTPRVGMTLDLAKASLATISLDTLPSPLCLEADAGAANFHMLSWQRLTSCLICEAIALGALSLPKVFATLGMVPATFATVGMGLLSIYTSMVIGEVKFGNPQMTSYADLGKLLFGTAGYWFVAVMLVMLCVLTTGSHVLTGIIAFQSLSSHALCSVVFGVISAAILFVLGLPKTFHKMAILAYVDFASITLAVLVTIIACALEANGQDGGHHATLWYMVLPKEKRHGFVECTIAVTNLALAYAYAQCLPSFMSELRRPQDYRKAIWTLGGFQIVFYTLTGALIYYFKGENVQAPAVLSLHPTMQKVVFGLAIPVIFISGSINSQTAARFVYDHIFVITSPHRYIGTRRGMIVWVGLGFVITLIAWISAEIIPSFQTFLGLVAALFTACFSFTLPALLYIRILRYTSPKSRSLLRRRAEVVFNVMVLGFGLFLLGAGSACCVIALVREFHEGVSAPFAC